MAQHTQNMTKAERQQRQNIRNAYFCESVSTINTAIDQFCLAGDLFAVECLKEIKKEIEKELAENGE